MKKSITIYILLLLLMYTPITQKNTLLPHYVLASLFGKKYPCIFYAAAVCLQYEVKNRNRNSIRSIKSRIVQCFFFWTDPITALSYDTFP